MNRKLLFEYLDGLFEPGGFGLKECCCEDPDYDSFTVYNRKFPLYGVTGPFTPEGFESEDGYRFFSLLRHLLEPIIQFHYQPSPEGIKYFRSLWPDKEEADSAIPMEELEARLAILVSVNRVNARLPKECRFERRITLDRVDVCLFKFVDEYDLVLLDKFQADGQDDNSEDALVAKGLELLADYYSDKATSYLALHKKFGKMANEVRVLHTRPAGSAQEKPPCDTCLWDYLRKNERR